MPSLQCESTQKTFRWYSYHILPKRQWNMMASLPCESTQKMLSDDTHIVLLPKKAMRHDGIITMWKYSKKTSRWHPYCIITKKGKGHDGIIAMWKYSKNTSKWYPYHIFPKKATADDAIRCPCHMHCVKVLKKCFQMIPILYITKKGNITLVINCNTCTNTCQKWKWGSVWENGLVFYTPSRNGNMTLFGIWHSFQIRKLS